MTTAELIAKLQTMPPDARVIYPLFSDYAKMREDHVEFVSADARKFVQHHNMPDDIREYVPREFPASGVLSPEFVSVVVFPGN